MDHHPDIFSDFILSKLKRLIKKIVESEPFVIPKCDGTDTAAGTLGQAKQTLHHHFRTLTAMSPLQYQKWLRLSEARRLMLTERLDVSTAAFQVGYESPSQFSREYGRLFGAPPLRDITNLREMTD
jgi:AraC-like DNA-binding protein